MDNKKLWPGWDTVRMIGRGSFGSVYEIQREVVSGNVEKAALKVLSIPQNEGDIQALYDDGYDEESVAKTFQCHLKSIVAEHTLMRKLNGCSNVVNCEDVRYIKHDDGIGWDIFIKMELLTPLAKSLPAQIPEETVIRVAEDICKALIVCKKHGVIHRDIKPQNIFLSPHGDYKLGDFGIAKTVEQTMGGTKIGTYNYMAPEVYNNQPYGAAVDIYSLGLVLYWLLNERRMPFLPLPPEKLDADMERRSRERRFSGELLPPPLHGSKKLKSIVLKACAFDPKDRYASAREMLNDLRRDPDPVPDPPKPPDLDVHKEITFKYKDHPAGKYYAIRVDTREVRIHVPINVKDGQIIHLPGEGRYDSKTDKSGDLYVTIHILPETNIPVLKLILAAAAIILVVFTFYKLFAGEQEKELPEETTHIHTWKTATCIMPKMCRTCGETEGEVADHQWKSATCTAPKTCKICGETTGFEAGHSWKEATCTEPKTCTVCGEKTGAKLEHPWIAATYEIPKTCAVCGETEGSPIPEIVAGDTITMGYYGDENIEWTVLEFDPVTAQALLISKYCIDAIPFHTGKDYGSWENSTLRKWLNNEFINTAFNQEERADILTKTISTPENSKYGTDSGNDTSDQVFLLSYEEAVYYFPSQTSRRGIPTDYCKAQGCYAFVRDGQEHGTERTPEDIVYTWWWLRTAGRDKKRTCNVVAAGSASTYGAYKTSNEGAVRPAMWVQLG